MENTMSFEEFENAMGNAIADLTVNRGGHAAALERWRGYGRDVRNELYIAFQRGATVADLAAREVAGVVDGANVLPSSSLEEAMKNTLMMFRNETE